MIRSLSERLSNVKDFQPSTITILYSLSLYRYDNIDDTGKFNFFS